MHIMHMHKSALDSTDGDFAGDEKVVWLVLLDFLCGCWVLSCYLEHQGEPPWTSYFVRYSDVLNDQRGMSHFNWSVGRSNYHVLRTGCFPYIKYHCSRRPPQDLGFDDAFFKAIKIINLGIPTLMYGLAATLLIRHSEVVKTSKGDVTIYFLLPEDKGSQH
ncbi:uncharacterized protein C15orf61 homolog isoform X1 [Copidosoma floridanum]|uniref:uncharacterized protein C15orf61 homolog isoform X1 n=1 Tax=Copidosoma floridanum TaxID=29053 RepID=UPI0006C99ED0|nr:uncharacterized protein C15orf61 homolog isoform X1 [Copidosoma floridanum]